MKVWKKNRSYNSCDTAIIVNGDLDLHFQDQTIRYCIAGRDAIIVVFFYLSVCRRNLLGIKTESASRVTEIKNYYSDLPTDCLQSVCLHVVTFNSIKYMLFH